LLNIKTEYKQMKDVMTKLSWSIVSQYLFFTCQAFCKGISKRILISFLLILLFAESFGQGEANVWYFGSRCGMEFPGGGTPIPKSSSSVGGSDIMESASSISDAAGNFLFGTNGSNIFSADLVTRGTLPNGSNE